MLQALIGAAYDGPRQVPGSNSRCCDARGLLLLLAASVRSVHSSVKESDDSGCRDGCVGGPVAAALVSAAMRSKYRETQLYVDIFPSRAGGLVAKYAKLFRLDDFYAARIVKLDDAHVAQFRNRARDCFDGEAEIIAYVDTAHGQVD